jgi:hypothetical protein
MVCLAVIGGLLLLRQVRAQVAERALDVGQELARADLHAGSTRVRLNGAVLTLNSSSSDESVDAVLDRFTALCAAENAPLGEQVDSMARGANRPSTAPSYRHLTVFRTPTQEHQGTAACIARNRKTDSLRELFASVSEAIDTGDLAKIGQFRYVFARKSRDTGATHVISVWSEGELNVEAMFPERGDAPGLDLVNGVRPAHATRFFAAEVEGSQFQLALYESRQPPDSALESYHARLTAHGYVALDANTMDEAVPVPARVYTFGEHDRIVVIAQDDGQNTLISTYRLGSSGEVALEP